jgi:hypothetical protein
MIPSFLHVMGHLSLAQLRLLLPNTTAIGRGGWVVRGGQSEPVHLQANFGPHRREPGIYGCAGQYAPTLTVDQLACAGQFPHPSISFARECDLMDAAQHAGHTIYLVKTRGMGYHYTLIVYRANEREALRSLPDNLATALSVTVHRKRNPFPGLR